jgi:pimeloyl-ACP methyl ester carboxylesterase
MAGPVGRMIWPKHSRPRNRRTPWLRLSRALATCLLFITATGCIGVDARDARLRNAVEDGWERLEASRGLNVSLETGAILARHGLLIIARQDPASAARLLEAGLLARTEPNGAMALAEVSYYVGVDRQTSTPVEAMAWYCDAATLAALALGDPSAARPDLAIDVHNRSVARLIRLAQSKHVRDGGNRSWLQVLEAQGLLVHSSTMYLAPERIGDLSVVSDLTVEGMDHVYRSSGLGVPLIAHRFTDATRAVNGQDQFFPREMRIAATAVVVPGGGLLKGDWRRNPSTIDLLDPFQQRSIAVGTGEFRLATDRTTPLAMQVARGQFAALEWTGLFDSNFERPGLDSALYMLRPYEHGKIPVVFVHGLFSSPRAWVQTINELQNTPSIASRYQFWLFMYPTGQPIPGSAARLRESLTKARETFDPGHSDGAFDRMVLVGHSMGGLLSKMAVQDSKLALWDAAITVPRDQFHGPPELQQALDNVFTFRPLPFVKRVVFVATPHRGSPIADSRFGQAIADRVRRPAKMDARIAEIEALNGPDVLSPEMRGRALNAISNLRTDSPILAALDRIPIQPGVRYHSIIPLIEGTTNTDGVVEYRSSHLEGALSEKIFAGTHISQQDPVVTRELDRILQEHLAATNFAAGETDRQ